MTKTSTTHSITTGHEGAAKTFHVYAGMTYPTRRMAEAARAEALATSSTRIIIVENGYGDLAVNDTEGNRLACFDTEAEVERFTRGDWIGRVAPSDKTWRRWTYIEANGVGGEWFRTEAEAIAALLEAVEA